MSLGLGQTASFEPVLKAAVDVGVWVVAGTATDSAKLPVKPPGYSASLTRPGVSLPLHECSWISCSNWYVLSFCLHECCRCELALDEDSQTTFETNWPFIEKNKVWDSDLKLWIQNDAWCLCKKWTIFEGLVKVFVNILRDIVFIWLFEILRTVPLRAKSKSRKTLPNKDNV